MKFRPPTLEELCGSKKQFRKNDSRQDKVQNENAGSLVQKAGEGTVKVPKIGSLFLSSVSLVMVFFSCYFIIYILFNYILFYYLLLYCILSLEFFIYLYVAQLQF